MENSNGKPVYKILGEIIIRVVMIIWASALIGFLGLKITTHPAFTGIKSMVDFMLSAALLLFATLYVLAYFFRSKI